MQDSIQAPENLKSIARTAWYGTSFSPEKRAETAIKSYEQNLTNYRDEIKKICGDNWQAEFEKFSKKYTELYINWLSAHSRCISTMITGPSNFPTRRAEKANNSERNHSIKLSEFLKKALKAIRKKYEQSSVIYSDDSNALERLRDKLQNLEDSQNWMKEANKKLRKAKIQKDDPEAAKKLLALGFTEDEAKEIVKISCYYSSVFLIPAYSTTNNGAEIRRIKARIEQLERQSNRETTEIEYGNIRMVENAEENRIQLFFPSKPDETTRKLLKSRGFRWSPRHGCWQCYFTPNGIAQTARILKELEII
jgi:predicted ATPase